MIYSLIETAKVNGLSHYEYLQFVFETLPPYDYLKFVFETLPNLGKEDDLNTLLPWRWKTTLPL